MKRPASRAKALASVAVTAGLCLAGTAAVTAPSQAATGSCDTAYPVADLTDGQVVTGLTVTQGTTPSGFTGDVIGVLHDGIEPGVDLVMVQLTSSEIDRVGGIWQGMSGSPVYATDGRLIGAVAYTLAWGPTPVAGVTPYEDMQTYAGVPASPSHITVSPSKAKAIASSTDVTQTQASQGFAELKTPQVLSGLGPRALSQATGRSYLTGDISAAGRTDAASSPTVTDMIAGGNLVATESTGDIVFGGLGTITSVCNGRVIGFGHPMEFVGKSSYGMAGADALYIQADSLGSSFKVANLGDTLGTIDQDRMTGISGPLGVIPATVPITSTVRYTPDGGAARSRTGSSQVQLLDAAAAITFYEQLANHQTVLDAYMPGSESQTWTVTGHTASGPFTFTGGNRYTDTYDIAYGSSYDLADLVWLLSNIDDVTLDSVESDSHVIDSTAVLKIVGAQQRRGGDWVTIDDTHPALVKGGSTATMRAVYGGDSHGKAFQLAVPARATGMRARVYLSQADGYPFERNNPRTVAGVRKLVHHLVRNDQAQVEFLAFGGKTRPVQVRTVTDPGHRVIIGRQVIKVKVS